jgi:hypothetical protein
MKTTEEINKISQQIEEIKKAIEPKTLEACVKIQKRTFNVTGEKWTVAECVQFWAKKRAMRIHNKNNFEEFYNE